MIRMMMTRTKAARMTRTRSLRVDRPVSIMRFGRRGLETGR